VAANNLYDAEYIKWVCIWPLSWQEACALRPLCCGCRYFTGLRNVPVIPNYCGYTKESYSPQRPEILVGPGRGVHEELLRELQVCLAQHNGPTSIHHPPPNGLSRLVCDCRRREGGPEA
jgi:hypothetical protein